MSFMEWQAQLSIAKALAILIVVTGTFVLAFCAGVISAQSRQRRNR